MSFRLISRLPSLVVRRSLGLTSVSRAAAATKLKEETTPIPSPNETKKNYSERIHRLVEEISKLSLIDVMDLNELLKVNPADCEAESLRVSL